MCNVLAQIERDAGDQEAAIKAHLAALGVPEPAMPPFDESKHEPMPEVEIEPSGEEHRADH